MDAKTFPNIIEHAFNVIALIDQNTSDKASKAVDRMNLEYNELKKYFVANLRVAINNDCNQNCKYCFINHNNDHVMSYDDLITTINWLHEQCISHSFNGSVVPHIQFSGGEPFTHFDSMMKPAIEYIRSRYHENYHISCMTNGTLLTEERLAFLKVNKVACIVSIDGIAEAHNMNRPMTDASGSIELINHNLILTYLPDVHVRMTLTKNNVEYFYESIMYLIGLGYKNIQVQPNLFEIWDKDDYSKLMDCMTKYRVYLQYSIENGEEPVIFREFKESYTRIDVENQQKEKGEFRKAEICQRRFMCGFGLNGSASCDSKGNVFTCDRVMNQGKYHIANIHQPGMDLGRLNELYELSRREDQVQSHHMKCFECQFYNSCTGTCPTISEMVTGRTEEAPPAFCYFTKAVGSAALDLMNAFNTDNNEFFSDILYGCMVRGIHNGIY